MAIARGIKLALLVVLATGHVVMADDTPAVPTAGPSSAASAQGASPNPAPTVASPGPPPDSPKPPATEPKPAPPNTVVLHRSVNVLGQNVTTADGKATGRIVDLLVNQAGQPRAAVIDFGGFLGLGTRRVAVDWSKLHFAPADKTPATVDMTVSQLEAAPEYTDTSGPVAVANPPPLHPPPSLDVPPIASPLAVPTPPVALPLAAPAPAGATP